MSMSERGSGTSVYSWKISAVLSIASVIGAVVSLGLYRQGQQAGIGKRRGLNVLPRHRLITRQAGHTYYSLGVRA
jgi:hypothetical protein